MVKRIAILIFGLSSISSIVEALKIFSIKNNEYNYVFYTKSFSIKNYLKSLKNSEVIVVEEENFDLYKLIKEFDFILNFSNQKFDLNPNLSFYYFVNANKESSLIVSFKNHKISTICEDIFKIFDIIKQHKEIYLIENERFLNQELIQTLKKLDAFKGVFDPKDFFKINGGIYLVNDEKLEFLKSFYSSLNDKQKEAMERKSIGGYFSKMVFSFQRDNSYEKASYNLFNYLVEVSENTLIFDLDKNLSSSEIIIVLNFITQLWLY